MAVKFKMISTTLTDVKTKSSVANMARIPCVPLSTHANFMQLTLSPGFTLDGLGHIRTELTISCILESGKTTNASNDIT